MLVGPNTQSMEMLSRNVFADMFVAQKGTGLEMADNHNIGPHQSITVM